MLPVHGGSNSSDSETEMSMGKCPVPGESLGSKSLAYLGI